MTKKILVLTYGVVSYMLFFGVFMYTILFIGNIAVSPSLDAVNSGSWGIALLIDIGLLTAFALQHSIMARPAFKKILTKIISPAVERSNYVLASSLMLGAVIYFWQPLGGTVWQINNVALVAVLYTLFIAGWAILFLASFQINHFDLFGLRQVWLYFQGKDYTPVPFTKPWLYRYVRHPLYVGMLIGMWAAPLMTVAHLVFALLCTGYIVVGARLEEKDLVKVLPEYTNYQSQVPMLIPKVTLDTTSSNEQSSLQKL